MHRANHGLIATTLLLIACVCQQIEAAETVEGAVNELAGKLRAHLAVAESWRLAVNITPLQESLQRSLEDSLSAALGAQGVRVTKESPTSGRLAVSLTETPQGFLLVADVQWVDERRVVIVPLARSALAEPKSKVEVTIEKTLLWEQATPILDAAWGENELLILDSDGVAYFRRLEGRWEFQKSTPIAHSIPWPRDLRGRLKRDNSGLTAYLPGTICRSEATTELKLSCEEGSQEWPLQFHSGRFLYAQFEAGRNFFTGAVTDLSSGKQQIGAFFSAAVMEDRGRVIWLVTRLDGNTEIYDGIPKATGSPKSFPDSGLKNSWTDFGSDLLALTSPCGSHGIVLAAEPAGGLGGETIQAFEIESFRKWAASLPIEFPGSVVALWQASETSATAIIRHSTTGRYSAYGLAVNCSR